MGNISNHEILTPFSLSSQISDSPGVCSADVGLLDASTIRLSDIFRMQFVGQYCANPGKVAMAKLLPRKKHKRKLEH